MMTSSYSVSYKGHSSLGQTGEDLMAQGWDYMADMAVHTTRILQWSPLSGCWYGAWHCAEPDIFLSFVDSFFQFMS
jgi:hypothetical protein